MVDTRHYYRAALLDLELAAMNYWDADADANSTAKLDQANAAVDETVVALMVKTAIEGRKNTELNAWSIAYPLLKGEKLEKP